MCPEALRHVSQGREDFNLVQLRNTYSPVCKGGLNIMLTIVLTQSLYLGPRCSEVIRELFLH